MSEQNKKNKKDIIVGCQRKAKKQKRKIRTLELLRTQSRSSANRQADKDTRAKSHWNFNPLLIFNMGKNKSKKDEEVTLSK